ncbi:MAG: hypothetical protein J7521_06315 [Caulobacter sp.]|nr:hypothetical protein [Caulobacter sp.]
MIRRRLGPTLAFAFLTPAIAAAQDIYTGTLAVEQDRLVLTRCDLVENRYVLRDAPGETAVADLRARLPRLAKPVYGEVIGSYVDAPADGDGQEQNLLDVTAIEGVEGGRSCHLGDLGDPAAAKDLDVARQTLSASSPPRISEDAFGPVRTAAVGEALVPPGDYAKGPEEPDPAAYPADEAGTIYDIAFAGMDGDRIRFEVRGYAGGDFEHVAVSQEQTSPATVSTIHVRDIVLEIRQVDAGTIRYSARWEKEQRDAPADGGDPGPAVEAGRP